MLLITSFRTYAQFSRQVLTFNNTTSMDLQVFVYSTYGTGGSCTELMWDDNTLGCGGFYYLVPHSSTISLDNYSIMGGSWWYNGASIPPPAGGLFYFTAISVGQAYTGWPGPLPCSPSYCQSYSNSINIGISCSGYPTSWTRTASPNCGGGSATWTDLGSAGTNATITFAP